MSPENKDSSGLEVTLVLPESADLDNIVDASLVAITEAIAKVAPDTVAAGCLGGEFGYGAEYENDVFMMHPYCWCEQETCPWCMGCDCPESAYHYMVDGREVGYQAWMKFYKRLVPDWKDGGDWEEHMRLSDAANARREIVHDKVCDYCVKHNGEPAPNFRHKASGFEVRWYKWIGREMKVKAPDGVDVRTILGESIASVRS